MVEKIWSRDAQAHTALQQQPPHLCVQDGQIVQARAGKPQWYVLQVPGQEKPQAGHWYCQAEDFSATWSNHIDHFCIGYPKP